MPVTKAIFVALDVLGWASDRVQRSFTRFIGVDLGGGRGKTTALAELRMGKSGGAEVMEVATRAQRQPWTDDTLMGRLSEHFDPTVVIAIDAPLTQTACGRCERPVCPGMEACADPAVVWLRTTGRAMIHQAAAQTADGRSTTTSLPQARLAPYAHRATDLVMTYERGLLPLTQLGATTGAVAARASQLSRRLRGAGYQLHESLIEVSPAATIAALCGPRIARGYKRDADPWVTRALVLEKLGDLSFAPQSRMAREDVLRNDHCFDAVISAYTAYRWAKDGWKTAEGVFEADGFIVAPP